MRPPTFKAITENGIRGADVFPRLGQPGRKALDQLGRAAEAGATAPLLWPLEALNGFIVVERRYRVSPAERAMLTALLRDLPIRLDGHTAEQAREATRELAERFELTVHDAVYLELARRCGLLSHAAALTLSRIGSR